MIIQATPQRCLGLFGLVMIGLSAILTLSELPIMASMGWQSLIFFLLGAVLFFIPMGVVCAKLARDYPENGGIYTWVCRAMGPNTGFVAIFLEIINNLFNTPVKLSVAISTLAYLGMPVLQHNKLVIGGLMLLLYWGLIIMNLRGIQWSLTFNVIAGLVGTLLPSLIILLLTAWSLLHHQSQYLSLQHIRWLPDLHIKNMVFFVGVLGAFSGMQISGFFAENSRQPKRLVPLSIYIVLFLIFIIYCLATLGMAAAIPQHKINMMNGVIEAIYYLLLRNHLVWLTPLFVMAIAIGILACMNAWIIGPAQGFHKAMCSSVQSNPWQRVNHHQAPSTILFTQGILTTMLSIFFIAGPTLTTVYWMMLALSCQLTVVMQVLLFVSAILLASRQHSLLRQPSVVQRYRYLGYLMLCLLGISACLIGFVVGFFPPAALAIQKPADYVGEMLLFNGAVIITTWVIAMRVKARASLLST